MVYDQPRARVIAAEAMGKTALAKNNPPDPINVALERLIETSPFSVHIGTAQAVQDKRAATIERFRAANPHRLSRRPSLPKIPAVAWINRLEKEQESRSKEEAA